MGNRKVWHKQQVTLRLTYLLSDVEMVCEKSIDTLHTIEQSEEKVRVRLHFSYSFYKRNVSVYIYISIFFSIMFSVYYVFPGQSSGPFGIFFCIHCNETAGMFFLLIDHCKCTHLRCCSNPDIPMASYYFLLLLLVWVKTTCHIIY